ncbi:hypothetical protein KDA_54350 [Dictyobacter alpinus]|uniref:DUF2867 domain-containing protein n=2 Tax=Dictyobacter alpinus TaxID=2014873 RepID=A0A402BEU0_9CHLR|nr:hypothetical protein KDA_54350 [Dictyobacter alpinus]
MRASNFSPVLNLPELQPLLANADYVDVKTVTGTADLRTFLAGLLNYHPAWLISLFVVRAVFVRLLGMRQERIGIRAPLTPERVSMQIGKRVGFFTVCMAEEERYWFAYNSDKHLKATLGVVVEPLSATHKRFHVISIVHYHNWTGPVYFQTIKPFHHLVVARMAQAGSK